MPSKLLVKCKHISAWVWDMPAGPKHCAAFDLRPGSACNICYAVQCRMAQKVTQKRIAQNAKWWAESSTSLKVLKLAAECQHYQHVRVFRSGDFGSIDDIKTWASIARACRNTNTRFWVSTRTWRKGKAWVEALTRLNELSNVCVRCSVDGTDLETDLPTSDVDYSGEYPGCPKQVHGSCSKGQCRACWDKTVPLVVYAAHGKKVNWRKR